MVKNRTASLPAKIRIAYVIDSLRRHGTQKSLVSIVSGLAERGYEQRVYVLNDVVVADIVQSLTSVGARVTVVGKAQLVALVGLLRLVADFRSWQPLIVQTFLPFGDVIGRTLARMANVPIIVSSIRNRNLGKRSWQLLLDRMTIRWADRVIFNSKHVVPFSMAREGVHPKQVAHVPNGVEIYGLRPSSGTARIRCELGIGTTTRVIGTVGRLYPHKGHRHLLSAFAQVLADGADAVLLMIGEGPLRADLEAQAMQLGVAGKTRFLGERADIPDLLACMDIYVHASLWEGMPNAVMEAMAAGKPVVATGVDGTTELITDGETGWLVEPSDTKAMAERIAYALRNVKEARCIGAAAAQRMAEHFTVDQMVLAYDSLYRELVATKTYGSCGRKQGDPISLGPAADNEFTGVDTR